MTVADTSGQFSLALGREDRHLVIRLTGELDLASARVLDECLDRLWGVDMIVLDVAALAFCDSTGLTVLAKFHRRAEQHGWRLVVRHPSRQVADLFELTELDKVLHIVR